MTGCPYMLYFNPRPPRGERRTFRADFKRSVKLFQSTPSARRATPLYIQFAGVNDNFNPRPPRGERRYKVLSIAALKLYFNPRPPRGERLPSLPFVALAVIFQSTPSARRATGFNVLTNYEQFVFQSTPSARRATKAVHAASVTLAISIHALREESDL